MKIEGYIYELNEKMYAIWQSVYDEAIHSDRYQGRVLISVDYDSMNKLVKDWEQIQKRRLDS